MTDNAGNDVKKRKLPQWAVNLLIWCCPTLIVLLIFVFVIGLILERETIIDLFPIIVIGLIITRLIYLFRSDRSAVSKAVRTCILLVLLFIQCFLFLAFFPAKIHHSTTQNAQSRFEEQVAYTFPGALSEPLYPGDPESVRLHFYKIALFIFESRSYTLLCKYDDAGYKSAKTALEARYDFRTEPLKTGYVDEGENVLVEPRVNIGEYSFRFIIPNYSDDGPNAFYKQCLLAVANDETREIGYILFIDLDLDLVGDMTYFINEYCGWKYVCD